MTLLDGCGNIGAVNDHVVVRPALPKDKSAVIAFCQNTFDWGDYIANVWDDWFAAPSGKLLVGVVGDQPVGLLHVAFLDDRVAWMEGMRVHPEYRRKSVGSTLDEAGRALAKERGCRVSRLATSIKNVPAQHVLDILRYERTAQFNSWRTEPADDDFSSWRVATQDDAASVLSIWVHSPIRSAARSLLPTPRWSWEALTATRLRKQIASNEVRMARGGFALIAPDDDPEGSYLTLHGLVGDPSRQEELALAARAEAAYRGYKHLEALIPDEANLNQALAQAGYVREGGMLIYEQPL